MVSEVEQRSRLFLSVVTVSSIGMIFIGMMGLAKDCRNYQCFHTNGNITLSAPRDYEDCQNTIEIPTTPEPQTKKVSGISNVNRIPEKQPAIAQIQEKPNLAIAKLLSPVGMETEACLRTLIWNKGRSKKSYLPLSTMSICFPSSEKQIITCLEEQSKRSAVMIGSRGIYKWQAFGCLRGESEAFFTEGIKTMSALLEMTP